MFTRYPRKFIDIIKEPTFGTDNKTYIKDLMCDRKAIKYMQAPFYGTSEGALRKQVARFYLRKRFYNN